MSRWRKPSITSYGRWRRPFGKRRWSLPSRAACEVRAQLPDRTVDLVLLDGDPTFTSPSRRRSWTAGPAEDLDPRITLRVSPTLKTLIEDAAETAGASVNGWVLDALAKRARKVAPGQGFSVTHSFDL